VCVSSAGRKIDRIGLDDYAQECRRPGSAVFVNYRPYQCHGRRCAMPEVGELRNNADQDLGTVDKKSSRSTQVQSGRRPTQRLSNDSWPAAPELQPSNPRTGDPQRTTAGGIAVGRDSASLTQTLIRFLAVRVASCPSNACKHG